MAEKDLAAACTADSAMASVLLTGRDDHRHHGLSMMTTV